MPAYATSAEYADFVGSGCVTATATATVVAGEVTTLTIGAGGGLGYTDSPSVAISPPVAGVRATAAADVANGVVVLLTLLDGGSGYGSTAPAVTIGPPVDVDRLLERASELIDDYLRTAYYATDDDDLPTDAKVATALSKATCAQVEYWQAGDEEDDILGPVESLALGGMTVKFNSNTGQREAPRYLAPRAARILREAELLRGQPVVL